MRRMFGGKIVDGKWRRSINREVRELCGDGDIVGVVKGRSLRWLGHLSKIDQRRTPSRIWLMDVLGEERRGRRKEGGGRRRF